GNPGVIDYYEKFLKTVYDACGGALDIIGVQHLGHVKSVDHAPTHNLQDQISHKIAVLDALRERYPPRTRFIIAGHSIGAYIALQVLRARPAHGIAKVYALFPTLHSIADTPNGRTLQYLMLPGIRHVSAGTVGVLSTVLPRTAFRTVVATCTGQSESELDITCGQLLQYPLHSPALLLGAYEMAQVKELDVETVQTHQDKLVMYYGRTDKWCPLDHHEKMKSLVPDAEIYLCDRGLQHAFVLGGSEAMGEIVSTWIKKMQQPSPSHENVW
ncbi:hypothetical protein BDK51DRAFT_15729, partial [Blyttiomyces helicus]